MPYGTLSSLDTLAAVQNTTVANYGIDAAYAAIAQALEAHNRITTEMISDLVEPTTDNLRSYGGGDSGRQMQELDQWGAPDVQKTSAGIDVGFPLRIYGDALGWTDTWMRTHSPADLAAQVQDMFTGDSRNIQTQIKRALYYPTNVTFKDRLVRNITLPLKALLNADSAAIPGGPNGETFDGATHTHYLANATFTEAVLLNLVATVLEHRLEGEIRLYINATDETTVRGFTTNFKPYVDPRVLVQQSNAAYGAAALDLTNPNNRRIGVFGAAEVWVKPWVIASYPVVVRIGPAKPLAMRVREAPGGGSAGLGDLRLVATHGHHPLYADMYGREFGISVWNRDVAAVADMAHGSYTSPV
jgi:hypothetical protein